MKAQLLASAVMIYVWAMPGFTQEHEGEEQTVSPDDLKEMGFELEAGADVETRGLSHAGTIAEIHHNRDAARTQLRQTCIKMNPTIPKDPWACLYANTYDPQFTWMRGINRGSSIAGDYWTWVNDNETRRLLHDAFVHNKRCKIWYTDASAYGKHNIIKIVSCYNP